jgi:hypothetical protein
MESGTTSQQPNLDSILREKRVFPPPAGFAAQAHVKSLEEYETLYRRSIQDPEKFWAEIEPSLGQVVCGRQNQSLLQLCRSSCLR